MIRTGPHKLRLLALAAMLLVACAAAQQTPVAEQPQTTGEQQPAAENRDVLDRPMDLPVELRNKLDTRKVKVGDPVRFKVYEATLWPGGVVIPKGATVEARIVGVQQFVPGSQMAMLTIQAERAQWKKNSVPMRAYIAGHVRRTIVRRVTNPLCRQVRYRIPPGCQPVITVKEDVVYRISDEIVIQRSEDGTTLVSDVGHIILHKGALLVLQQFDL